MGMVVRNKQEKAVHVAHLLHHLWHGRTDAALTYLRREVQAKTPEPLAAWVTYLEKHQAEISDDGRRQRAGKPMGSGRMEKGVDQVIGVRQNSILKFFQVDSRGMFRMTSSARYCKKGVGSSRPN